MSLTAGKQLLLSSPAGGYQVSRSLRFNSADSANLSKTFASAGNQTTWTLSCWFKLCRPGSDFRVTPLFSGSSPWGGISIYQDKIRFAAYNGAYIVNLHTTQVFRDPSAWYHLVAVFDSNNGTSGDRARLYLNGSRITAFSTETYPSSGATTTINSTSQQYIGYEESNAVYSDCYFADYWFLDGIATDASSFGKTDVTTGQWIPKTYTGAKSGNSFHLEFADNSNNTATTLGKDTSGNGNNWTPNNLTATAKDYNALVSGTATGGFNGSYPKSNAFDNDLSTYASSATAGSSEGAVSISLDFTSIPVTVVSTVRVYFNAGSSGHTNCRKARVNGGSYVQNGSTDYADISFSGTLTSLDSTLGSGVGGGFTATIAAIDVDGVRLVSSSASNIDSLVDTPTSYGADTGAGGEVRGNYCTWNPLDKGSSMSLANGNLDVSSASSWNTVRGTIGISSGKWYWEYTMITGGLTMVGIGTKAIALGNYIGDYSSGYAYYSFNGTKWNAGASAYGSSFTTNDVISVAFDADAGKIWFAKNGTWQASGSPAAGTNAAFSSIPSDTYFPGVSQDYYEGTASGALNAGQRPFAYTAPSGFKALCDTNLTAPVIAKPNTVFDAVTYDGNSSTKTVTGYSFSPDFVWIKCRNQAEKHALYDQVRGVKNILSSNLTSAEIAETNGLSFFNSDGYTLDNNGHINYNGYTYVGWAWDAGSSAAATNNNGSIISTVKVNATAGFSIVSYNSGSSTGNFTLGHGLNVAPKFIIHKSRSTSNWWVYHASVVDDLKKYMQLNSTNAIATNSNNMWGGAFPTSSVFGVTVGDLIGTSQDAIAYVFSPVAGYSSFGSYTGSAGNTFVYTGFRPRLVMIKRTDTTGSWYIIDALRPNYNNTSQYLLANASDGEYSDNVFDLLSNGFKLRLNAGGLDGSGGSYIYCAWAESPFQYARAR